MPKRRQTRKEGKPDVTVSKPRVGKADEVYDAQKAELARKAAEGRASDAAVMNQKSVQAQRIEKAIREWGK